MCHALADTRGLRPPSVRPNHLAAPSRQRAPWDVPPPLAKILGSQSDLLVRRAGRDHPFPVSAGSTSGPQRLVCRIPCSGQAQCTSRRDFAPFSSSTHRDNNSFAWRKDFACGFVSPRRFPSVSPWLTTNHPAAASNPPQHGAGIQLLRMRMHSTVREIF